MNWMLLVIVGLAAAWVMKSNLLTEGEQCDDMPRK